MLRKARLFYKQRIVNGFWVRFAHIFFNALFAWVLTLAFFANQNQALIGFLIPQSPLSDFYNSFWLQNILLLYAIVAVLFFNILITTRKIKFELWLSLFIFAGNIVFGWVMIQYYRVGSWPITQTSILIFLNITFAAFARLALLKEENRVLKKALSSYTNPDLTEDVIAEPNKQLDTGGEQRQMTVLFADLRGFTSIAEKTDPKYLVAILNEYFEEMSRVIISHKGTIDKFMGDAIMAFWNAPVNDPKHAQNALEAGIGMILKLNELQRRYPRFASLKIGIGINTGKMIIGNIGSKRRLDYTVIGDNVNLGSRMEALTKSYGVGILIAENVIKQISNPIAGVIFRQVDEVIVKGKSEGIKLFQPLPDNEYNRNLAKDYAQAFRMYQKGHLRDAQMILEKLVAQGDPVSKVILDRIPEIYDRPSWDGVWIWQTK